MFIRCLVFIGRSWKKSWGATRRASAPSACSTLNHPRRGPRYANNNTSAQTKARTVGIEALLICGPESAALESTPRWREISAAPDSAPPWALWSRLLRAGPHADGGARQGIGRRGRGVIGAEKGAVEMSAEAQYLLLVHGHSS